MKNIFSDDKLNNHYASLVLSHNYYQVGIGEDSIFSKVNLFIFFFKLTIDCIAWRRKNALHDIHVITSKLIPRALSPHI
jgi:hypothetical protein